MAAHDWLTVVSCAGLLGLALLAVLRASRSALAGPLAFLCLVLFGWSFFTLAHDVSGQAEWRYVDTGISPLTAPATLHFISAFVGARRRYRHVTIAAYGILGAVGLSSVGALFVEPLRVFAGSEAWALVHLVLAVPVIVFAVVLVVRHQRRTSDPAEQMRTRLVLAALVLGAVFAGTELWADLGAPVPRLGALGTFGAAALLSLAAFRLQLLGRELSRAAGAMAVAAGAVAVVFYLVVFRFLGASEALLVIGTITVTFGLVIAVLPAAAAIASHKGHRDRLALLGRMSDQMAHDLKNPLAAVKGAVQFLQIERAEGRTLDAQARFLDLIEGEVSRIERLLERYRRLGRMQAAVSPRDPNDVVRRTAAARRGDAPPGVAIRTELDDTLPASPLDADLVATALDNLVANAFEAMPSGGEVTLSTGSEAGYVWIAVADRGAGMDARTREQAFDEFYTTKASGSGLGLPFVRRVAEAHGGSVEIESTVGEGTVVKMLFPVS